MIVEAIHESPVLGVLILFKLNFEKTAIFVLLLIVLVSTANIYTQFFGLADSGNKLNTIEPPDIVKLSFPVMLLKADELYDQGDYESAQKEYLALTSLATISKQQKATLFFRLGLCNYAMKLYDMASESFIQSTNYNTRDAVAYNNAAVCAFMANNTVMAENYQKSAIAILPAVEFHYNLGRIYETDKKYEDAAKYYIAALKGENNITREDSIDPVRVNLKVIKLFPEKEVREKLSKELFIALKLSDARDVFIINDSEMDLKTDFESRLYSVEGTGRLNCRYNREKMDPYHLIDTIKWSVKKDNKVVYTSSKDEFTMKVQGQDDYEVALDIMYNGNKIKSSNKIISKWQIKDKLAQGNPIPYKQIDEVCKFYSYAAYEQLFEEDFLLSAKGFTDRFSVVWGKDSVGTGIMTDDFMDAGSSLEIANTSKENAGIWADLSSLIDGKDLKGKTISVKFFARKISERARLDVKIRIKTDRVYNKGGVYPLKVKWQQINHNIYIPEDATGLTLSLSMRPDEEIKIDGFIISVVK
ncbi:MAG TPA: hypothetical protein VEG39_11795 [Clostridia bacterium]|nr:hypothetical protein [Clostridia bacterium]